MADPGGDSDDGAEEAPHKGDPLVLPSPPVGQRGMASAVNRNPLPRGRACESVDWLTELFKFLPPSSSSCGVPSVRVPLTLVFRHSRPHTWYIGNRRGGVQESPTRCAPAARL